MVYFIFSSFVLIASFAMFRIASGSLSFFKPNMISYIFYYNLLMQTFTASILTVLKIDGHYIISTVSDEARHIGWLSINYMMVAMPFGMIIAKTIFLRRERISELLDYYVHAEVDITKVNGSPVKYSIWLFTVISLCSCIYVFVEIGYLPFVKLLSMSSDEIAMTRINVSRDFSGNVYVRNFFAITMMPILSYMWYFYYIKSRSLTDLCVFFATFLMSMSILYYDFSKSPVLWYLLSYIFVFFYCRGKLRLRSLLIFGVSGALILIMFYTISGVNFHQFFSYNSGPVGRIILTQAAGFYKMLDLFPDTYSHIEFSSISRLLSEVLNFEYTDRAARLAMISFNPDGVASGVAGVMNTIYLGEAWANFGILGILISPLWVGFLIQAIYVFFLKQKKTPFYLAFFVFFSIGGSVTGGFNDYLYNPKLILVAFFGFMVLTVAGVLRKI